MHLLHLSAKLVTALLVPMKIVDLLKCLRVLDASELLALLVVKVLYVGLSDLLDLGFFLASLTNDGDSVCVVNLFSCHFIDYKRLINIKD